MWYNKCKGIVQKLEKRFVNERKLASVNFSRSIPYGTNEYYLYMFYSCLLDYGMRKQFD